MGSAPSRSGCPSGSGSDGWRQALGYAAPGVFTALAVIEIASINLSVAVLIWAMIFPMMVDVDFGALRRIGDRPKGLVVTLVNWLVKPFTMAPIWVLRGAPLKRWSRSA